MPSRETPPRVGITMRVVEAQNYKERRDAISQEWYEFLSSFGIIPIFIPNIGDQIEDYLRDIKVDGLILSGGNDVAGDAPDRDETETKALEFAEKIGLPVVGICRGLQMINFYFGGAVEHSLKESPVGHVATKHPVTITEPKVADFFQSSVLEVNSFHNQGVFTHQLSDKLREAAVTSDGVVEALYHPSLPIFAVCWHPERENSEAINADVRVFKEAFFSEKPFEFLRR